jgi:hypothetical protein
MFFMMQAAVDDGLTLGEVVRDLPHDAGAIVVYVLMLGFIGLMWYGNRRKSSGGPPDGEHS